MNYRPPSADRVRGTFLGQEPTVKPGWTDHTGHIESSTREVHYDILRVQGCSAERAREISAVSADKQARLLDQMRGDRSDAPVVRPSDGPPARLAPYRTPYFGPFAGQLCRVEPDGTLVPVTRNGDAR